MTDKSRITVKNRRSQIHFQKKVFFSNPIRFYTTFALLNIKTMKQLVVSFFLFFCLQVSGQDLDSEFSKFAPIIHTFQSFSRNIPQKKVYLHFENTGYYLGDIIWCKCYVVTSGQHQLSRLSKTLYVELFNPGGEIADKRILKIENRQCHVDFTLNQLSFYSGFYEMRAYTQYMLNFGHDVIFSRLLPVFDKPKTKGNFEEKEMLSSSRWGTGNYPMKREVPLMENRVKVVQTSASALKLLHLWE